MQMKEASIQSKRQKMKQELEEAIKEVDKCREYLSKKKEKVKEWMAKVNKSCIESIRSLQTPPVLIGQIMEMSKIDLLLFSLTISIPQIILLSLSFDSDRSKTTIETRNQRC